MKNVDVSGYLQPARMDPNAPEPSDVDDAGRRFRDPTYSVVLGYGFRKSLKPRPEKKPPGRATAD